MTIHPTTNPGAWITTDPTVSDMVELDIIRDGQPINTVVTGTPVGADDYGPAIDQADSVIREAGYRRTTDWTATNNGFVADLTHNHTNYLLVQLLDSYQGDNIWEDVIYRLDAFDAEATDELRELHDSSHSDIDQHFVAHNVVFYYDGDGWSYSDVSAYGMMSDMCVCGHHSHDHASDLSGMAPSRCWHADTYDSLDYLAEGACNCGDYNPAEEKINDHQ